MFPVECGLVLNLGVQSNGRADSQLDAFRVESLEQPSQLDGAAAYLANTVPGAFQGMQRQTGPHESLTAR